MKRYEVEQKYRCCDLNALRRKLKSYKAKLIQKGAEINELWDKNGELAKKKTILRLRRHGEAVELTLKGPRLKSRFSRRIELQTPVEYAPTRQMLLALGYRVNKKYSKKREVYRFGRLIVTLDTLLRFGTFVELEGGVKDIVVAAKKLGIKDRDREERSYLQMIFGWRD